MKRVLACAFYMLMFAALMPAGLFAASAAELPTAGQNYDQYPGLRDVYKDYFLVGTIDRLTDEERNAFINYTYNASTNENNMKPSSTQNTKGTFTFEGANKSLDNAVAVIDDAKLIGHTLTWHSQSPNWMWDAPNFNRDVALENLYAHIDGVLGEFGGRLYAIDVVNEAMGSVDPKNTSDWKKGLDKGEGWALALGWEWVELAFLRAAKVVDENGWDCKLYYNDFSLEGDKGQAVYAMVKDINERYKDHRPNGKPLIEGVGIQGHFNMSTKMGAVEETVALLAELPDVKISFTEVDVEYLNEGALTEAQLISQAQQYAQLFAICKKYAAGSANTTNNPKVVERITFWGTDDGYNWKRSSLPMLFNAPNEGSITAKEALIGALWPEQYLEKYPVIEEEDDGVVYSIPGVYVYSLSRGDIWSGANIILGKDPNVWPWSATDEDGEVAFTPEKDSKYRLSVNYTALGTAGIRIRWVKDNTNGGYTAMDGQVVGAAPYNAGLGSSDTATMVPAHFNSGMVNAGTYTLVTEITLDGSLPADDLIGNLAIRGTMGGNAYEINWIKMEKVGGDVLFVWDPTLPPPEPSPEPSPEISPEPQTTEESPELQTPVSEEPEQNSTDDTNNPIFTLSLILFAVLATAIIAFILIKKGKK